MKKNKLIASLCALVLTIACLTFGVYSAVKTSFTASGSITFNSYNCDVDVQLDVKGIQAGSTTTKIGVTENTDSSTKITTRTIRLTTIADTTKQHDDFKAGTNAMLLSDWDKSLGNLVFDELNTALDEANIDGKSDSGYWLNHIEITISLYNYSGYSIKMTVASPTTNVPDSNNVAVEISTSAQYAAKYTSGTQTALKNVVVLSGKSQYVNQLKNIFELTVEPNNLPTKGQLISMDLDGSSTVTGIADTYRILKIDGTIAEVMAMFDAQSTQKFWANNTTSNDLNGKTVTKYEGSDLDVFVNTTWYEMLNEDAKSAILPTNITQYSYNTSSYDSGKCNEKTHSSYADYDTKASVYQDENKTKTTLKRNVYVLDIEDIEMYFDGNDSDTGVFSTDDLWNFFWKSKDEAGTACIWFRSASIDSPNNAWYANGSSGGIDNNVVFYSGVVRPAFKIDLSKIEFSMYEG